MKCLVKTLNVVVNNPDLPVLETMQQFTLNAIAASGNSSMTDAQKWALNRFFHQIGAISNNETWQKVKCLIIPMICGDNKATVYTDYTTNTVHASSYKGDDGFVNHGFTKLENDMPYVFGTNVFTGNSNNLSAVYVTMATGIPTDDGSVGNFIVDKNTSDRRNLIIKKSSAGNYFVGGNIIPNLMTNNYSGDNIYDIASYTSATSFGNMKLISSSDTSKNLTRDASAAQIESRGAGISYSNNALRYSCVWNTGLAMLSEALTDDERDIIMLAAKDLKLAFSESNT